MGCRVLTGKLAGTDIDAACFYCSTSDWVFGPLLKNEEEAATFLEWLPGDPRSLSQSELERAYGEFLSKETVRCEVCERLGPASEERQDADTGLMVCLRCRDEIGPNGREWVECDRCSNQFMTIPPAGPKPLLCRSCKNED